MRISKNISKTLEVFFANLGTILVVYIVLALIGFITAKIFNISYGMNMMSGRGGMMGRNSMMMANSYARGGSTFLYTLLQGTLSLAILGTNQIALLGLLRNGEYSINGIVEIFKENYKDILIVAFLITLINTVLAYIPLVGGIIAAVAAIAFSFSFFLIYDFKAKSAQNYLKGSANLTNGHKLTLFVLGLIYSALPIIFGIILAIGSIAAGSLTMGLGGVIISVLLLTLTSVLTTIGQSVYYDELIKEKEPTIG